MGHGTSHLRRGESIVAAMMEPYHAQSLEAALAALQSGATGLSDAEAHERLARFGPNRLEPARPVRPLVILLNQLRSVVVVLLMVAGVVSLALGEPVEAGAIGAVLLLNTVIGFVSEWRARSSMDALLRFEAPRASVLRAGHLRNVDAAELVPGDVVQIDAGDRVPADGRILDAVNLRTNEAALTGESLPVTKMSDVLDRHAPLADRRNMVYKGTTVAAGTARIAVTGTGARTELGRIGTLVAGVSEKRTPLEERLDDLGRRVVWGALGVAAAVAGLEWARGGPMGLVLETGIALAVAAVPEALPAVATIALAVGMRRMARRRVLIRRLPVVEALGSTTVVCSDKTRTLTSGVMTVVKVWAAGREILVAESRGIERGRESRVGAQGGRPRQPSSRVGQERRARSLRGSRGRRGPGGGGAGGHRPSGAPEGAARNHHRAVLEPP